MTASNIALALLLLGSAAGVALTQGTDQPAAGGACAACQAVTSGAQLERALAAARPGDRITLAPGARLGTVVIRDFTKNGVTIESADPLHPASFASLAIYASSGLNLRHLRFDGPMEPLHYKLLVMECQDIAMDHLAFVGDDSAYDDARSFSALMLRRSKNLRLGFSHFDHFVFGLSLLDVDGLEVNDNAFLRMKEDGIRGGGVSNAVIRRNQIADSDFKPKGHPDGIQLWTTHTTTPAHDIVIEDNLVRRGKGGMTQGIFVNDEDGLPYQNLVIRGNLVAGTMWNGITAMGVKGGTITNNTVIPAPDQRSWIRVEKAEDTTISDNHAGEYVIVGPAHQLRNRTLSATGKPEAQIDAWLRQRGMVLAQVAD